MTHFQQIDRGKDGRQSMRLCESHIPKGSSIWFPIASIPKSVNATAPQRGMVSHLTSRTVVKGRIQQYMVKICFKWMLYATGMGVNRIRSRFPKQSIMFESAMEH